MDIHYFRQLVKLYEPISTQKKIPKEIIIPVYDMLYRQGETDLAVNDLFNVCILLVNEDGIQSLEDFENWMSKGNKIELID